VGTLHVAGRSQRTRIRRDVAVARITAAVELEPELRVADHLGEAATLTHGDARWARDLVGSSADSATLAAGLPADESVLLSVALALAGKPKALVVDDVDRGATAAQRRRIWRALCAVAAEGTTVVASVVDADEPASAGAHVVPMEAPDARD
jgi:ABC-type multidrug transport system ATPase subunit